MGQPAAEAEKFHGKHGERRDSRIEGWRDWEVELGQHLLGGFSGKESSCQCRRRRRHRFGLWVGTMPWNRKWQPTPLFLPGEFHGQRSLVDPRSWGHKESDTTEHTHTQSTYVGSLLDLRTFNFSSTEREISAKYLAWLL